MQLTELRNGTIQKLSGCVLSLVLLTITACQPQIFASSDSPDGKYRCEVIRVRPLLTALFGDGEFRYYHFYLVNRKTYQRLTGDNFEYGDGKIQLEKDKIGFKWASNELMVTDQSVSPARSIAVADFDGQEQHWKQVR